MLRANKARTGAKLSPPCQTDPDIAFITTTKLENWTRNLDQSVNTEIMKSLMQQKRVTSQNERISKRAEAALYMEKAAEIHLP